MHDCASILASIAKGISRFVAWCIPTSILNDFYTCSKYFSRINAAIIIYAATRSLETRPSPSVPYAIARADN